MCVCVCTKASMQRVFTTKQITLPQLFCVFDLYTSDISLDPVNSPRGAPGMAGLNHSHSGVPLEVSSATFILLEITWE